MPEKNINHRISLTATQKFHTCEIMGKPSIQFYARNFDEMKDVIRHNIRIFNDSKLSAKKIAYDSVAFPNEEMRLAAVLLLNYEK
jgi:hypothetical protein